MHANIKTIGFSFHSRYFVIGFTTAILIPTMANGVGIKYIITIFTIIHRNLNIILLLCWLGSTDTRLFLELDSLLVLIICFLLSAVLVLAIDKVEPRKTLIFLITLNFSPNMFRESNIANLMTFWLWLF